MPARAAASLAVLLSLGLASLAQAAPPDAAVPRGAHELLPPIRHIFVLLLENQSYSVTFGGHSPASYLARLLPARGALLTQYYAIGHASLGNYIALVSGQAPNLATQLDCSTYADFRPSAPALDEHGQLHGSGCIYPRSVTSLPDQLEAAGLTWRAYMEDMGKNPARESSTCGHVPVGAAETTDVASRGDQYAAKHNPFVYFHAIIDDQARCDSHVVNLERLPQDLASAATTANYIFITPNLCSDGHDVHCIDGRAGGLTGINRFLRRWVPLIEAAPAFLADGMLIITFDESDGAGAEGSRACCGERALPGARFRPGFSGPGGGRVGAIVLSKFVKPGTVSTVPYNHYSLLRTVETIFGLPYLGYAAEQELRLFGADVFSAAPPH